MSSINNLKDAGRMLPAWVLPLALSAGIIGTYMYARGAYTAPPHALVSMGTMIAILASLFFGAVTLLRSIAGAPAGQLSASINKGAVAGLTFIWATSSVALVTYVSALPLWNMVNDNLAYTLTGLVVIGVLFAAHRLSTTQPPATQVDPITGLSQSTALALPPEFMQTKEQRPAFQVSMADLTRLMIHQAGRILAYKGSNCMIEDSFSADLDINARTAKIFSEMNLIATPGFLYWRMHMMLMGSAAEQVLRNTTSEAALDDINSFDELAARYLQLSDGRTSFYKPANDVEATIKASRMGMMRKQVFSRCMAAASENRAVLLELVKLMRAQSCLAYGDIKHLLDRVKMPVDFPVAEFDTEEMMEKAMMSIAYEQPSQDPTPDIESEPEVIQADPRVVQLRQPSHLNA